MSKRKVVNVLLYNIKPLIVFQILYKILLSVILVPVFIGTFRFVMFITGYKYITLENINNFLFNPITFIFLFLIIVFLALITFFDITTLIVIFDQSYHSKKIRLVDSLKISLNKSKKYLKLKNLLLPLFILFLIPFLNIGILSCVFSSIRIPEFIVAFINSKKIVFNILTFSYIFIVFLFMNSIFSVHYMIIEDKSLKEAIGASKKLIKGNTILNIFRILLIQFLLTISYSLFLVLGIILVHLLHNVLGSRVVDYIFVKLIWLIIGGLLIITSLISNSLSFSLLSNLFYNHKNKCNEKIVSIDYKNIINDKNNNFLFKKIVILFFICVVIGSSSLTYQFFSGKSKLNVEHVRSVEVTAHRGASSKYPENTMAAFNGAYLLGADYLELDLQQTKDMEIVVTHDSNLYRVTGVKKEVNDITYNKLKTLDAGSFFDESFSDERIPLLRDVIAFAKEKGIKLNIELKPTGREVDFEKQVVDIIHEYDFQDKCVVTSQSYETLERIKKEDETIKTVYVMVIAIGDITKLKYADAFSVESMNINADLVRNVHNAGSEIYVWTINTEESVNRMVELGVDNIITDDVEMVKSAILKHRRSNIINRFIEILK